jgi:hypothetical protein
MRGLADVNLTQPADLLTYHKSPKSTPDLRPTGKIKLDDIQIYVLFFLVNNYFKYDFSHGS